MHERAFKGDDEIGRLAALRRYEILDSAPERDFQDIVSLVRSIFDADYTAINFIDNEHQWTKALAGGEPTICKREDTFCNQTIRSDMPLSIEDTLLDERFVQNIFVQGEAKIRSYLGVPLTTTDGYNIGALCVYHTQPRKFSTSDTQILDNFSKLLMSHLDLRITARIDSLTGALTRRAFHERLAQLETQADQTSIVMIDIDYFKKINDTYGHATGDLVLKEVSQIISSHLGRRDFLGRLGGEEFAICTPNTTPQAAYELAEKIRQSVWDLHIPALTHCKLSISLGIANDRANETLLQRLERADAGLYASKRNGRNQITEASAV